jgi:hypothetical protein
MLEADMQLFLGVVLVAASITLFAVSHYASKHGLK